MRKAKQIPCSCLVTILTLVLTVGLFTGSGQVTSEEDPGPVVTCMHVKPGQLTGVVSSSFRSLVQALCSTWL